MVVTTQMSNNVPCRGLHWFNLKRRGSKLLTGGKYS